MGLKKEGGGYFPKGDFEETSTSGVSETKKVASGYSEGLSQSIQRKRLK